MKIAIAADKAGFELKEKLYAALVELGNELEDLGQLTDEGWVPYYEAAENVATALLEKRCEKGILICGTGAGMCVTANKFKGIYAVCCESTFSALYAAVINDANVITLGQRIVGADMALEMCKVFLEHKGGDIFPEERAKFLKDLFGGVVDIETKNFNV